MVEGKEMVGVCDGSYISCSEIAGSPSAPILSAKSSPTTKLDVDGARSKILLPDRSGKNMQCIFDNNKIFPNNIFLAFYILRI